MQTYLAGNTVVVTVPLVDETGELVAATAASYKVIDEVGGTIVPLTAVPGFTGTESEVAITVTSAQNTLGLTQSVGAREVQLILTTATGTVLLSAGYRVSVADRLIVPSMSFQSLTSAEMVAADLNSIPGWKAASNPERVSAMLEAHRRLCQYVYSYSADDWQSRVNAEIDIDELDELTPSEFTALPIEFSRALKIAQVYEANEILGGDPTAAARGAGLLSDRVGETEQRYRDSKAARYVVGGRALSTISKFLASGNRRIGRA